MTNPITMHLDVIVCDGAEDAIAKGFNWADDANVSPIEVEKVVVVRGGMESGRASVDFVLRDGTGKRFVFMVTHALLQSIPG